VERDSSDGQSAANAVGRIRTHLEHGAPWDACDAFREAIEQHPSDARLLYWGALAHARSGASHAAHALLDRAQAAASPPNSLTDILSLRGRLWKDAYHRAPDAPEASVLARRAREQYLAAYAREGDPFPGINAATLCWILGDRAQARRLASEVCDRLAARGAPRDFWDVATSAEAQLLLGRCDEARDAYVEAYRGASGDAGSVATMRRQVALLARTLPEAREMLGVLPVPDVVAFAGHMIDAPDRAAPRFPAALVPAVEAAVRAQLARFDRPTVYASAACGSDLIGIEAALAMKAEVNVVLPFDRADFVRTSVAVGGEDWVARFDAALGRASRLIMATEENHLGDDVLFDHAARLLEGLAVLRAKQLETEPSLLCVIDPASDGRVGGTHASFERWRLTVGEPRTIDLRELRTRVEVASEAPPVSRRADSMSAPAASDAPIIQVSGKRPRRTLKTLLFADFAGFSRLHDAVVPLFQERFWKIAAGEIDASPAKPLLATTWGDALYVVFDAPIDGADFSLRFLERLRATDWTALGLADAIPIRVALHAGPVFCGFDPIMGRDNYFGSSVTRAARIEPITPPGMVYASEAFAASLAADESRDFLLEYIGRVALAKGYGESRIYRLDRVARVPGHAR
jgi:class 3 adenylate cyclase